MVSLFLDRMATFNVYVRTGIRTFEHSTVRMLMFVFHCYHSTLAINDDVRSYRHPKSGIASPLLMPECNFRHGVYPALNQNTALATS